MPTPQTKFIMAAAPVLVGTTYPDIPIGVTAPSTSGARIVFPVQDMRDKTTLAFFGTANDDAVTARIFKVHKVSPISGTSVGYLPEFVGDISVTAGSVVGAGPTDLLYIADTLAIGTTLPADASATVISPTTGLPASLLIKNTGEDYLVIDGYKASDPVRLSVGYKAIWEE